MTEHQLTKSDQTTNPQKTNWSLKKKKIGDLRVKKDKKESRDFVVVHAGRPSGSWRNVGDMFLDL